MKACTYMIIFILFINCLSFSSLGNGFDKEVIELHFFQPNITPFEEYLHIDVNGTNGHLYQTGKPVMPFYSTQLCLPFKTKVIDIECKTGDVESMVLYDKIVPALKPAIPGIKDDISHYAMDPIVYASEELFPENWYGFYTGGGLDSENEHKTFLNVRIFPVRYSPLTDTIHYIENIEITITFKAPEEDILRTSSKYDLTVIAPLEFSDELQSLIDHKNSRGVQTILKTVEEIYNEYPGVDKPEQIKYFIKTAVEEWQTEYVLLVGGKKGQLPLWYLPVRYVNMGNDWEPHYVSDLYYADIYDSDGNFSSWDSDVDGIYGEWHIGNEPEDKNIDLYPDVAVGRLPCRNSLEVQIMVNKIIEYETTTYGATWFNDIIAIAGDTYLVSDDPLWEGYEGEYYADRAIENMTGFNPIRLQ